MNQRLPGPQRRQQLLDVAFEIFGVGGYGDSSMADIASAAGVTKPVVYQHFPSKRELYLEVLRECGRQIAERVVASTADADGPQQLVERGFQGFITFFEDNPGTFRILFNDANRVDPEFAREVLAVEVVVADRIAALIDIDDLTDEDRRLLAVGIVGLGESAVRHWLASGTDMSADRVTELLTELTWAGLRGSG